MKPKNTDRRATSTIIVAAAQIHVHDDSAKNLKTMLRYLKKAASRKINIVCFPETSLIHDTKGKITAEECNSLIKKISYSCKQHRISCIFSTHYFEKNKIYNRAFFIDDLGTIAGTYDKMNLWKNENQKISPGQKSSIITTKFGKIGIIICWDMAFPGFVQKIARQGAWIVFCPSYLRSYNREADSYLSMPYARAFENSCAIVFTDAANKNTLAYSCICTPDRMHVEIRKKEGMIHAILDRKKIEKIRKHYNLIKTSYL